MYLGSLRKCTKCLHTAIKQLISYGAASGDIPSAHPIEQAVEIGNKLFLSYTANIWYLEVLRP